MKTKVVQPGDLSPHSLRAEDYMRSQGGPITREDVMKKVIEAGRTLYQQDGFIEIDDNALPSLGEPPIDGFYLQAWVWINLSDLDLDDPSEVEKLFSIYRKKRKP